MTLSLDLSNLLEWLTKLRKICLLGYYKAVSKDTDEEMHRVGMKEASMPFVASYRMVQVPPGVQLSRSSPNCPFGFLWILHCMGMIEAL
jgi:hypothetical protein